jgi:hypothetical protein
VTETEATGYGPGVEEAHKLWISEGMSCDVYTISVTAAMLPSIEDVLLGNIPPGLPTVHLRFPLTTFCQSPNNRYHSCVSRWFSFL